MDRHQEEEDLKNALDRIRATFLLREFGLMSFVIAITLFEITGMYDFYEQNYWLIGLLSFWVITAYGFRFLVQRQKTTQAVSDLYLYYDVLVELPILAGVVYFVGGAEWLGSLFFFAPIVFTSIYFSKKRALFVATMASIFYSLVVLLPFFDLIPFQPYYPLGQELYKDPTYVSVNIIYPIFTFYLIAIATNIPTGFLKKKTRELSKTKIDLEKERKTLEDKVEERTRELNKQKMVLEDRVHERTQDLQERVNQLESFHRLATGRELKMVELKEEIKEKEETIERLKRELGQQTS